MVTLVPHARLQLQIWAAQVQAGHAWGQERAWSRKARYPPTARHPKPFLHSQGRHPSARPWGGPRGFNLFIMTPRDVGGRLPPAFCSPWPQVLGNSHLFPTRVRQSLPTTTWVSATGNPDPPAEAGLVPDCRVTHGTSQGHLRSLGDPSRKGVGKDFLELLMRSSGERPERWSGRDMGDGWQFHVASWRCPVGGDQPAAVPRQVVATPWATGSLQEGMAPTDHSTSTQRTDWSGDG